MGLNFFSKTAKPKVNFILDIGTESVKGLILEKKEGRISVLGSCLEYYDRFSVFFRQFEKEVVGRTILKVVSELERETKIKSNSVTLSLPPDIFVSRVISQNYKRKKEGIIDEKEKESILRDAFELARKEIAESYTKEKGILPDDLRFPNLKILETKIDGYTVPDIQNYDGNNLDFRILASVVPKYYLDANFSGFFSPLPIIKELGFKISELTQTAEGLTAFLVHNPEAIFLDIGGEITQIFWAKNGLFEKISEFRGGGNDFSRVLSERLGLQEPEASALKHRYSKGDISEESRQRLRVFFEATGKSWFKNLRSELKKMSSGIFPSDILIFGGGALLPEIKEALEEGNWEDVSFACPPKVKLLQPQDLNLSSQYLPSLLLGCVREEILNF